MMKPVKPIIALDCDGVLADWHEHAFYILNKLLNSNYSVNDLKEWDIDELLQGTEISKNKFWEAINTSNMVSELNPYPEAIIGVQKLKEIADVYVCTSPMINYPNWIIQRNKWLSKHFDIDPKKVIHTSAKYLVSANIFVDDHPNNVQKWIERQNGIAVLWKHNYNSAHENTNRVIYTNDWNDLITIMNNSEHPWSESYTEFKVQTLSYLKEYGKEIGQKSKEGNEICKRIISNYELLYKSFDAMTHELLKIDLYQYLEDIKENGNLKL